MKCCAPQVSSCQQSMLAICCMHFIHLLSDFCNFTCRAVQLYTAIPFAKSDCTPTCSVEFIFATNFIANAISNTLLANVCVTYTLVIIISTESFLQFQFTDLSTAWHSFFFSSTHRLKNSPATKMWGTVEVRAQYWTLCLQLQVCHCIVNT